MAKNKNLNKKQLALINDLLPIDTDVQEIIDKHNVTANTYYKLLIDGRFCDEINRRLLALSRQTEMTIARYASLAAANLVSLTNCKKEETARHACLDIINMPMLKAGQVQDQNSSKDDNFQCPSISEETAGKLLATLAEAKK